MLHRESGLGRATHIQQVRANQGVMESWLPRMLGVDRVLSPNHVIRAPIFGHVLE